MNKYFSRCIQPLWATKVLANGLPNPDFKEEIEGPKTIEGIFTLEEILKYNEQGFNCYHLPNHPSKDIYAEGEKYASAKHIDVWNRCFFDIDFKDQVYSSVEEVIAELEKFPVEPTKTVISGNGVHSYWDIFELTQEKYIELQFRLINRFRSDPAVWSSLRLMRIPGTFNTKEYRNYKQCYISGVQSSENRYMFEELSKHLPEITPKQKEKKQRHLDRLSGKITLNLDKHESDELPQKFKDLLKYDLVTKELWEKPYLTTNSEDRPDRSIADYILGKRLHEFGYTEQETFDVLANTQKALEHNSTEAYASFTVDTIFSGKKPPKLKFDKRLLSVVKSLYGNLV